MLVHLEAKDPRADAFDFGSRLGSQPSRTQPGLPSGPLSRSGDRLARDHARVDHEEHVGKGRTKVGAVDRSVPRGFGRVEVFAARAVEFDGFLVRQVREAEGEEGLAVAEDARTPPKVALFVLFNLRGGAV